MPTSYTATPTVVNSTTHKPWGTSELQENQDRYSKQSKENFGTLGTLLALFQSASHLKTKKQDWNISSRDWRDGSVVKKFKSKSVDTSKNILHVNSRLIPRNTIWKNSAIDKILRWGGPHATEWEFSTRLFVACLH